ncbi:MAG: M28 family peptidase [Bacteroidota bacterium]
MKITAFTISTLFLSLSIAAQEYSHTSIKDHLVNITQFVSRNESDTASLNAVANYIHDHFDQFSDSVAFQNFQVAHKAYKNVIASFGAENSKRLIIGAHYDVCGIQPGADDNASGVVGLLKIAEYLKEKKLNIRIDLVAYTLEEPPYFSTKNMGSYKHAEYLKKNGIDVEGMICLEMIGYFDERKKTQDYPTNLLRLFYGSRADYITVVSKFGNGKFSRKYIRNFKRQSSIRDKKFKSPSWIPGVDFSDHRNYWAFGYSAIMITDTAFYRNRNYHEKSDTVESLDLDKMKEVIETVCKSLKVYER